MISLSVQKDGTLDFCIENYDLQTGNDLLTDVYISLFARGLAYEDDTLNGRNADRGGFWGDTFRDTQTGSRLWLLPNKKTFNEALLFAKQATEDALQHLIEIGVAQEVQVTTEYAGNRAIQINITITQPNNQQRQIGFTGTLSDGYDYVWCQLNG